MNNQKSPKESLRENEINLEENISFTFGIDLEEKYNKLYSNFEVKERKDNFWDIMYNKNNNINLMINKYKKLNSLNQLLNYKDYQIINNSDFSFDNKNNNNIKYKNYNGKNNKFIKQKKGRNRKTFNYVNKNTSNDSFGGGEYSAYELNLDKNKVYNRLYNRGFYIKNKTIIKRIKNEEKFCHSMSDYKNFSNKSKQILANRNKFNNINKKHNQHNKSLTYYNEDETFKPNIDKNSIRIVKKLQKRKNNVSEQKSFNFQSFYINEDKNNINKIKYDIFKNNYKNLYNYFNNRKYSDFDEQINKIQPQRIISLHKRNIEYYNKNNNIDEIEKNNDENFEIIKHERINPIKIYENNKKWEQLRNEKIKKMKLIKENMELYENRKELDLPGKQNYEKYKNLIIKVFSPKEKLKNYSLIQKKNNIQNNNIIYNNIKNKEIKINKKEQNSPIKRNKHSSYHRQILKYINNEGKELSLFDSYFNVKNSGNHFSKENNINCDEFMKLVKENNINNLKINNKNKEKSTKKYNRVKTDKNSLEYKLKNIKNVFNSKKSQKRYK